MPLYSLGILTFLVQLACAAHVVRTDRSWLWIIPIVLLPWIGCAAYLLVAVLPDAVRASRPIRRMSHDAASIADPGTSYRRKKRDMETIGSAQTKRVFAEECIKRGQFQEAVDLYTTALEGAHSEDPALLHGLARARLLAGDGAGAQAAFETLKSIAPADFTADARLDLARALALQGKDDEAKAQYCSCRHIPAKKRAAAMHFCSSKWATRREPSGCFARLSIPCVARPAIIAAASANGST